jgi:hypothetical protein
MDEERQNCECYIEAGDNDGSNGDFFLRNLISMVNWVDNGHKPIWRKKILRNVVHLIEICCGFSVFYGNIE